MASRDKVALYNEKISERISVVQADIRSFIYLRAQPAFWYGGHGLGDGKFTCALCSFALLSTLAKCHRAATKPEKFVLQSSENLKKQCAMTGRTCVRLHETNESAAFSAYAQWLQTEGIDLGVDHQVANVVWSEYRNWLVHRLDTTHLIAIFKYNGASTTKDADDLLRAAIRKDEKPIVRLSDKQFEFRIDLFYALLDDLGASMLRLLSGKLQPETEELLDSLLLGGRSG